MSEKTRQSQKQGPILPSQSQKIKTLFKNDKSFDSNVNAEDHKQKNWDKLIKKISFEPPNDEYYSSFSVKPGFWFWKQLAMYEKSNNELKVRIPDTFIVLGNNNFVWMTYSEKTGKIERKNELTTTQVEFEAAVKRKLDRRLPGIDSYLFVHRSPGRIENEISKNVFTKSQCDPINSGSPKVDHPSMLQEYIYPKGQNAAITRICYKTGNSREMASSYGFKLVNYQLLHDPSSKQSISKKATICKDAVDSFEFTPLFSGAVDALKSDLEKLVKFMERAHHVILTELVADFIIDVNNVPYLYNVKALKMDPPGIKINKNLDELSCSVYCKLCGNIFKKDDASKILTYKLLWEFEKHLKKRGIILKDIDLTHNSTRPCRVCDLCYDVVVAEHKLIDYVQKFALAQNIQLKDLFVKVPTESNAKNRPVFVSNILRQWRLLFYIKELKFESKYKPFLETIKFDNRILYFHLRVGNCKACFPVELKRTPGESSNITYSINILKLVYFFSEPLNEITPFLKDSEIQFRITETENWNSELASGSTKTLNNFQFETFDGQKQENMVYLFFKHNEFASLKIIVGMVSDGECNTASMNLYKYANVYFPDDDFYSCNIFPSQWIEIFSEDSSHFNQKIEQEAQKYESFKYKDKLEILKNELVSRHKEEKRLNGNFSTKSQTDNRAKSSAYKYIRIDEGKGKESLKSSKKSDLRVHKNEFVNSNTQSRLQKENFFDSQSEERPEHRLKTALPKIRLAVQHKRKHQSSKTFNHEVVGQKPLPVVTMLPDMNKFINQWLDEKQHEDSLYEKYINALNTKPKVAAGQEASDEQSSN